MDPQTPAQNEGKAVTEPPETFAPDDPGRNLYYEPLFGTGPG